jgi:hypothetical protein
MSKKHVNCKNQIYYILTVCIHRYVGYYLVDSSQHGLRHLLATVQAVVTVAEHLRLHNRNEPCRLAYGGVPEQSALTAQR